MVKKLPQVLQAVSADELITPEVGEWAEHKYQLLFHYANMFASSMKDKWDQRVYVDLFASAGKARVKNTSRIVLTSGLLALSVENPFDRYIFCESDPSLRAALKARVESAHPGKDVHYVAGDCNSETKAILQSMPKFGRDLKVLTFCFIDPCKVAHFKFSTIRALATRYVDFLILVPTGMDINRNLEAYSQPDNSSLDGFLGRPQWRDDFRRARQSGDAVDVAITRIFGDQMRTLGYKHGGVDDSVLVRYDPKNVPLYRLGFFSRHPLGGRFWKQAKQLSDPQTSFLDD